MHSSVQTKHLNYSANPKLLTLIQTLDFPNQGKVVADPGRTHTIGLSSFLIV